MTRILRQKFQSLAELISKRVCHVGSLTVVVSASDRSIYAIELLERGQISLDYPITAETRSALINRYNPADKTRSMRVCRMSHPNNLLKIVEQRLGLGVELSDLPTTQVGTTFQHLVWRYIRTIPRGRTATYSEVAAAIGAPRAVRAVANACACNKIALAIPCHRVVNKNGSLGGYRWGIKLKQHLLSSEAETDTEAPEGAPYE